MASVMLEQMQDSYSVTGIDGDRLSVGVRRLIGIQTARQRLDTELYSMRQLVKSMQISKSVPAEMRQLAKEIGDDRRRQAERAARQLDQQLRDDLDRVSEGEKGVATVDAADPSRVVIPPEVLVVYRLDQVGSSRIAEFQRDLEDACDGDPAAVYYAISYFHWIKREDPMNVLRRSLLPILVSDFEEFLAALVRVRYLSSVVQSASIYDDVEKAVKMGKDVVSGGTQEWCNAVAEMIDLRINTLIGKDWERICEIFARRNAIIHADGRVDTRYLGRIAGQTSAQPSLGSVLVCDEDYSDDAIQLLEGLADVLAVAFAARLTPGVDGLPDFAMQPVFRALQAEHWSQAKFMADAGLQDMPDDHLHHELRVNRWMARKMLAGENQGELHEEIEVWSPPTGSSKFALAKSILLEDENGAVNALKECGATGQAAIAKLKGWPLVVYMCQQSEWFKKEFDLACFGRHKKQVQPSRRKTKRRK
jgi:hypothetical protein